MKKIKPSLGKKILDELVETGKVTLENLSFSVNNDERICVGCGCSDLRACPDGCCWIDEDENSIFGICSNCEEQIEKYS